MRKLISSILLVLYIGEMYPQESINKVFWKENFNEGTIYPNGIPKGS